MFLERSSWLIATTALLTLSGCGDDGGVPPPADAATDAPLVVDTGTPDAGPPPGPPVSAFIDDDGCTTTVVFGLSRQLVDELECLMPGVMGPIDIYPEIELGAAAFPFIQGRAAESLGRAASAAGAIRINSSLRTLPQQYLLYQWFLAGRCGISLAARPGRSNHESGLAVDIAERDAVRTEMEAYDFSWLGPSDAVHYDYVGPGGVDLRTLSVRAFQRLWNLNNPDNAIVEDGMYGMETEDALARAPSDGFPLGATCGSAMGALTSASDAVPECAR